MKIWVRLMLALLTALTVLTGAAVAAPTQWEKDSALASEVFTSVQRGGILAVRPYAGAIKAALSGGKKLFPGPIKRDGGLLVLADGPAEEAAVLSGLKTKAGGDVTALANPYPPMAFVLGSYYIETGKFKEAISALDAGLALSPLPKARLGETVPSLISERGSALTQLKKFKEAIANYDMGLALSGVDAKARARLYRGKGFALTELGRLDEAEAAYKASLKLEPGNPIAKNELAYIAGLRKGAPPSAGVLTMPNAKN